MSHPSGYDPRSPPGKPPSKKRGRPAKWNGPASTLTFDIHREVVAHLRKGETYADLATGFGIGTTTVFRYIREAIDALAALAPTLAEAIEVAVRKAFVILDGTLLRIDGSRWARATTGRTTPGSTRCMG